jgi:anaerobic magnesium-protoporphyrin IX monomethyl ester cyclase
MARFLFLTFYDKICLGPRVLSSVVREAGHESEIILCKEDATSRLNLTPHRASRNYVYYHNGFARWTNHDAKPVTPRERELLVELVRDRRPDVLCLSTRSFWTDLGAGIIREIRRAVPGLRIVAGGWGPSLEPEKYLEYCDHVCFGEGEEPILAMAEAIEQGRSFDSIPNLAYRRDGEMIRNPAVPPIRDLDALPFPDFDLEGKWLIEDGRVARGPEFYNPRIYDVFAGRGCPLSCSYCMSGQWDRLYKEDHGHRMPKVRLRSPESCIEEIRRAKERGALFIRIKDEVFPSRKGWTERFLELYEREIGLPFFAYLRPEFHKPEMVRRLRRAGLRTTGLGIQSGSDRIRWDVFHRRCSNEKVEAFAKVLELEGIEFHYDLIAYNPFETEEDLAATLDFLLRLPISDLKVFKLAFFPRAPIGERMAKEKPRGLPDRVQHAYALLYQMAHAGPRMRKLARVLHRTGLFRVWPSALQALFLPALARETLRRAAAKKRFRAASLILPGMQRRAGDRPREAATGSSAA